MADGAIPDDEIWLKLGGDKGGGTFKMCFQHLNVLSPNAPENTCVFTMFAAPDTYTNIRIALERYSDVIDNLETRPGGKTTNCKYSKAKITCNIMYTI